MEYYIVSQRHMFQSDCAFLFWGPDSKGYTYNLDKAGKYPEEAVTCIKDPQDDIYVLCSLVDSLAIYSVIDSRELGKIVVNNEINRKKFNIRRNHLMRGKSCWDLRAFCTPVDYCRKHENTARILYEINTLCFKFNPILSEMDKLCDKLSSGVLPAGGS